MSDPSVARQKLKIEADQEIRFAVVMYGGVSLAIYINGVTQELLDMVRATAPKAPLTDETLLDDSELTGAMRVYRKLGQYIGGDEAAKAGIRSTPEGASARAEFPIRTRFIVDVISGTSAGGINGIFLSKALSQNQSLAGLKKLWLSEGDLAKLLNDKLSVNDLQQAGFRLQKPQTSLLNSQRMYRKLLEALDQMEDGAPPPARSPLVGELDLFITTTDIDGVPLPLKLSDRVIYERRHRNIFHFRYADATIAGFPRNDFEKANDPFLAFAARCTSSFPFAFEPMRLCDIERVTRNYGTPLHPYRQTDLESESWDRFFSEYLRTSLLDFEREVQSGPQAPAVSRDKMTGMLRTAFARRAFGDGGYLDNKPFTHATAMLMRRQSDLPVDRKLIYIEPSPEHPELIPASDRTPDFLENTLAALLDLPRQETIREDIDRLMERNAMIDRLGVYAGHVDDDLASLPYGRDKISSAEFEASFLERMLGLYGVSYGGYHRLKVEEITDLLSELVTRAAGHDQWSDAASAVRGLVVAWRTATYRPFEKTGPSTGAARLPALSENAFLRRFDIRYCLRRLIFTTRRINELSRLDDRARTLLETWYRHRKPDSPISALDLVLKDRDWRTRFRAALKEIKTNTIATAIMKTRACEEQLRRSEGEISQQLDRFRVPRSDVEALLDLDEKRRAAGKDELRKRLQNAEADFDLDALINRADFCRKVAGLNIGWPEFCAVINASPEHRPAVAHGIVTDPARHAALEELLKVIDRSFSDAGVFGIEPAPEVDLSTPESVAWQCIEHFLNEFFSYDMVVFPISHGTSAGEANRTEVIRISPEDATAVIDERKTGETRRKLAGTTLMNFGAFLEQGWRRNDMLWGRLDGAERLISAVLPKADHFRTRLIKEAHQAILNEEVHAADRQVLCRVLGDSLGRTQPNLQTEHELREAVRRVIAETPLSLAMESILNKCLDEPEKLWKYYRENFEVNRKLDAETALRLLSRSTSVIGCMLGGLAEKAKLDPAVRASGWIATFGQVFWNAVAVAVPGSLGNLFVRHWLAVLYVFSVLLIIGGVLLNNPIKTFGWQALGFTVAVNLIIAGLGDYIAGRWRWLVAIRATLAVILISLLALGSYRLVEMARPRWPDAEPIAAAAVAIGLSLIATGLESSRAIKRAAARFDFVSVKWVWIFALATLGMGLLLQRLGPPEVAHLELARSATVAQRIAAQGTEALWKRQLLVDFGFIPIYVAYLAISATVAMRALISHLRIEIAAERGRPHCDQERIKRRANLIELCVLAATAIAWSACLAGALDAAEDVALLAWLKVSGSEFWIKTAFCCAASKFALLAMGFGAAAIAFGFIPLRTRIERRWRFLPLAVLLGLGAWLSVKPLWMYWPR